MFKNTVLLSTLASALLVLGACTKVSPSVPAVETTPAPAAVSPEKASVLSQADANLAHVDTLDAAIKSLPEKDEALISHATKSAEFRSQLATSKDEVSQKASFTADEATKQIAELKQSFSTKFLKVSGAFMADYGQKLSQENFENLNTAMRIAREQEEAPKQD